MTMSRQLSEIASCKQRLHENTQFLLVSLSFLTEMFSDLLKLRQIVKKTPLSNQ